MLEIFDQCGAGVVRVGVSLMEPSMAWDCSVKSSCGVKWVGQGKLWWSLSEEVVEFVDHRQASCRREGARL